MAHNSLPHRDFAAIPVVCSAPEEVVNELVRHLAGPRESADVVHLLSTHAVAEAHRNPEFLDSLQKSDWVIPDGRWLQILTKNSARPLQQLRGQDLFLRVMQMRQLQGIRHYFLLSQEALLNDLRESPGQRATKADLVGGEEFPYEPLGPAKKKALITRVKDSKADVVWFGISSPRQNIEAQWISQATQKTVICVGAALEFVAGRKPVAPRWVQNLGAEWLHRFFSEPRRLARRYLMDSLAFVRIAWRHRDSVFR